MSGREITMRRLAEENPERFFCWSETIDIGSRPKYTGVAQVRCRVAVLPGFDGTDYQVFEGDDFLLCVSLVREYSARAKLRKDHATSNPQACECDACQRADRDAYERDMAEGHDRPCAHDEIDAGKTVDQWLK